MSTQSVVFRDWGRFQWSVPCAVELLALGAAGQLSHPLPFLALLFSLSGQVSFFFYRIANTDTF